MSDIDKLDENISDIFARACQNNEYFGNDGWYELHTPTIRQEIKALLSTAVREARVDEIKRYREAMTFAHITPSIYAAERIPELLNEEQS